MFFAGRRFRQFFSFLAVAGLSLAALHFLQSDSQAQSRLHGPIRVADAEASEVRGSDIDELERTGVHPPSFMRQKLESVQKVVEGLTTENLRMVVTGTDELLALAEDASWKVPRDAYYIHYSRDFKKVIRDLRDAAERGSVEEATFAYTHATVSCMACHRHVRGVVPMSIQ